MSQTIKLSGEVMEEAKRYASVYSRSIPKQIEHWVKIGKIMEENPDMPYDLLKDVLLGLEEQAAGEMSPYRFGPHRPDKR